MHDQLRSDQQWHRQQKADMDVHVEQERDRLTAAEKLLHMDLTRSRGQHAFHLTQVPSPVTQVAPTETR